MGNPDCITSFSKEEAKMRGTCQANGFSACALDAYNKCMEEMIPGIKNAMEKQSVMAKAVHLSVESQRQKFKIAFHDMDDKLKQDKLIVAKMHQQLEDPSRWTKFYTFAKTPRTLFPGTKLKEDHDLGSCRNFCGAEPMCKSFSYSRAKSSCQWSAEKMAFSDKWTLHIKPRVPQPGIKFYDIPGMKWDSPDQTQTRSASNEECEVTCYFDDNCGFWSHNSETGECVLAGRYFKTSTYDYYEKTPVPGTSLSTYAAQDASINSSSDLAMDAPFSSAAESAPPGSDPTMGEKKKKTKIEKHHDHITEVHKTITEESLTSANQIQPNGDTWKKPKKKNEMKENPTAKDIKKSQGKTPPVAKAVKKAMKAEEKKVEKAQEKKVEKAQAKKLTKKPAVTVYTHATAKAVKEAVSKIEP